MGAPDTLYVPNAVYLSVPKVDSKMLFILFSILFVSRFSLLLFITFL